SMNASRVSHVIQEIDGYLCELGVAEIRGGLHVLGAPPQEEKLVDMLFALTRLPNLQLPALPQAVAAYLDLDLETFLKKPGQKLAERPAQLERLSRPIFTAGDGLEAIYQLSRELLDDLLKSRFQAGNLQQTIENRLGKGLRESAAESLESVLVYICRTLVPDLAKTSQEIQNILAALDGRFIPPGPSGAPTRGMAHVLPTGRNFYSVDPRSLPSASAWNVGKQLAGQVLEKYLKENKVYPESVSLSAWGTSAMRTSGDDIAQVLYLMGVEPIWQAENRRVIGLKIIPLNELKRPRINVITRISGFFRDAFSHLIYLVDDAVRLVANLDEPEEMNYVRKHYLHTLKELKEAGVPATQAEERAAYRIFGSKPGSYGAGILGLIQEKNWQDEHDFANTYLNWGGYAYSRSSAGREARDDFARGLTQVEIAIHNQDNREHDIFDSDDYLQFHGGMIATIYSLTGRKPKQYFGDSSDPGRGRVRDLKEESYRVFRSRVVNPKWLRAMTEHGYKGALELAATVDYLFGFDATAKVMDDWMYEKVATEYVFSEEIRRFIERSNPWALNSISERLLEAAQRGLWEKPKEETLEKLKQAFLDSEARLEGQAKEQAKR
ncbi:MAG TPA: cobaltochelatase subunit CobN, partial [Candidatus Obscuribacter sp.]|nr:cobaltochelatase subunit CobN [Candidatus Obscuribacter sp.]